jgi:hypothetical protein
VKLKLDENLSQLESDLEIDFGISAWGIFIDFIGQKP